MGIEHLAAVLDRASKGGSHLVILLVIASYSDHRGEWIADQATLQKRARLGRRRVQQILDELVAAGELAILPGDGRGNRSTYRLKISGPPSERAQPSAPFPEKGEAHCALSAQKGAAECTLSAPPCPPFPPHPQSPLNPPKKQDPSALPPDSSEPFTPLPEPRPLSAPQSAVFRVNLLLEDAGVPLPTPAQIGHWSKTLGGIEPLLELLGRLIHAGLANKREPIVYAHRVVMERAARPEPTRAANLLRTAGVDDKRREQAARIAGKRGGA